MKIPELLVPVKSMDYLKVAINAGASSVYLSGKNYGARKFIENFTLDEIKKACDIAHLYNVKVYVTVNTLIRQRELKDVVNYLNELYAIGVDAVIVQDLGVVQLINEHIPELKIHASTQMTIENKKKLDYLLSKNVKRVILPREMTYSEIKDLKTPLELEIFAHGSLCYSYSGQCLMSSFKGGRSGNRGVCAQPCRKKYSLNDETAYHLSPKDLCLYDKLEEIADLNIDCIKIEGRMRSKEYMAVVVSSYRKALNKLKSGKSHKSEELSLVFNRGFIHGKLFDDYKKSDLPGHIGLEIGRVIGDENSQLAVRLYDNIKTIPGKGDGLLMHKSGNSYGFDISGKTKLISLNNFKKSRFKELKDPNQENRVLIVKKVPQNKKASFNLKNSKVYLTKRNSLSKKAKDIENNGKSFIKSKLQLTFSVKKKYPHLKGRLILPNGNVIESEVTGTQKFEKPQRKNVSTEVIEKQLRKVDNYPYQIIQINMNYDGSLFIPIREINKIRRNLFKDLKEKIQESYMHEKKKIIFKNKEKIRFDKTCLSYYTNNLDDLNLIDGVKRVYFEIPQTDSVNRMVNCLKKAYEISKNKDYKLIWKWPDIVHDGLYKTLNKVRGILNRMDIKPDIMSSDFNAKYGSYSMNITNSYSADSLDNYEIITLSCELTGNDLRDIFNACEDNSRLEVLVQGRVELMKTRYGFESKADLLDNRYPIHENLSGEELIIFNDEELSKLDEIDYLKSIGCVNFSIDGRYRNKDYIDMINVYNKLI